MLTLVQAGHTEAAIIIDEHAAEAVRFAARELATYVHLISGARMHTFAGTPLHDPAVTIRVAVAGSDDAGVPEHPDGFHIRADDTSVSLLGRTPAATLRAAYTFASDVLGVGYPGLGPLGDEVPVASTIEVPRIDYAEEPAIAGRGLMLSGAESDAAGSVDTTPCDVSSISVDRLDWMAKHGLNRLLVRATHFDPTEVERILVPEASKRGIRIDWSHHNMGYWLPSDVYGARHPEYYAVRDAIRADDRASQLCLCTSNPAVADEVASNMVRFLDEHPWVDRLGLWPNDGYGMCECDACSGLDGYTDDESRDVAHFPDSDEAIPLTAFDRNKANRYTRFLNDVASRVTTALPDARIGALFYVDVLRPAPDVEMHPAVDPMVALYWRCSGHSLHDGACPTNGYFARVLDEWLALAPGRVELYEYYMGMGEYSSLPFPIADALRADQRAFAERGIAATYVQSAGGHHTAYAGNYALFGALARNPDADVEVLLEAWHDAAYGAASHDAASWWSALTGQMGEIAAGEGPDTHDDRRPSCYTPTRLDFPALWDERLMAELGSALDRAAELPGLSHGQAYRLNQLRTYHVYCVASNEAYARELEARALDDDDPRGPAFAAAVVEALDQVALFVRQIADPTIIATRGVLRMLERFRRAWEE